jgi:hypothetical protein
MRTLMRNTTLDDALAQELYAEPALVPASPWLGTKAPAKPTLTILDNGGGSSLRVSWAAEHSEKPWLWLLQTQNATGDWKTEILPANRTSQTFENTGPRTIALSAVDRFGNTSAPTALAFKPQSVAWQTLSNPPTPSQPLATAPQPTQPLPKSKRAKKLTSPKAGN